MPGDIASGGTGVIRGSGASAPGKAFVGAKKMTRRYTSNKTSKLQLGAPSKNQGGVSQEEDYEKMGKLSPLRSVSTESMISSSGCSSGGDLDTASASASPSPMSSLDEPWSVFHSHPSSGFCSPTRPAPDQSTINHNFSTTVSQEVDEGNEMLQESWYLNTISFLAEQWRQAGVEPGTNSRASNSQECVSCSIYTPGDTSDEGGGQEASFIDQWLEQQIHKQLGLC